MVKLKDDKLWCYWVYYLFSGCGKLLVMVKSFVDVIKWVVDELVAIGYVWFDVVIKDVKVLMVLKEVYLY